MCFPMEIISWYVQGLGGVRKRRSVEECLSKCNPSILILQETKKEDLSIKLVKSPVGPKLLDWCVLPAIRTFGGIIIA